MNEETVSNEDTENRVSKKSKINKEKCIEDRHEICTHKVEEMKNFISDTSKFSFYFDKVTGKKLVAKINKLAEYQDFLDGFYLREISLLKKLDHPNIIKIEDIFITQTEITTLTEYFPKILFDELLFFRRNPEKIKIAAKQLLQAVAYIHSNKILHRDLKTSNIYLRKDNTLVVADFNHSRIYSEKMTPKQVSPLFRSIELLLGCKTYDYAIDMWSIGIILGSMALGDHMFDDHYEFSEMELLSTIFKFLNTPTEETLPGINTFPEFRKYWPKYTNRNLSQYFETKKCTIDPLLLNLIESMLIYDPKKRITAIDALKHPYFNEFEPIKNPIDMRISYQLKCSSDDILKKRKCILDAIYTNIECVDLKNGFQINRQRYISYIDRFIDITHENDNFLCTNREFFVVALICYIISYYLDNIYDTDMEIREVFEFNVSNEEINTLVVKVLNILNFDL